LIRAIAYVSNFRRATVVALDRTDQSEQVVRGEVSLVHVGGEPGAESAGDVPSRAARVRMRRSRIF
jgi:hypothetical protein